MKIIDMSGQPCPLPVIAAKKALKAAAASDEITIVVDNDIARQNLEKMAAGLGHQAKSTPIEGGPKISVLLTVGCAPVQASAAEGRGLTVAISSDTLGSGPKEELGKALMKSFIQSLTELETPPEYVFFFNSGAFLTTEGSSCLEDLKALADTGAVIATCGACLNFYKLADKLKIGAPTNMLAIASTMAQAAKVINV
ncbi:MAG: sulfurtransferase-like selenium metabolism protein YedF [Deltaproteobacteria bacterium]|jgi:selenium metabolism protein YedF|nr:sulfurtransferase-like selenium metabolism protein YedF [Deltaproteobacteria bacterium]